MTTNSGAVAGLVALLLVAAAVAGCGGSELEALDEVRVVADVPAGQPVLVFVYSDP